jgi:transcriptional regulator with XRE-family HTH domain
MAKTASILTEEDWKRSFGQLLAMVAEAQNISSAEIARRLDRISGSTGRNRAGDWSRYVNKGRIPSREQLRQLSAVLRVPLPVMSVCAGYVDDLFERVYAISTGERPATWSSSVKPLRAAVAFLFALFPDDGMHIGRRGSMFFWMLGNNVRLNLTSTEGFLTGKGWNAIWLYPVRSPKHLIAHHETPDDPNVKSAWTGEPRTEPWTGYSMRALLQVDLASGAAAKILSGERIVIPKTNVLSEAQHVLHRNALPLTMRLGHAAEIVHCWADKLDEGLAADVREHVHPWDQRTITDMAARWVTGERIKPPDPSTFPPDTPRPVEGRRYRWERDGRPHDFWA